MEAQIDLDDDGPGENHPSASSLQIYRLDNQSYPDMEAQVNGLSENYTSFTTAPATRRCGDE